LELRTLQYLPISPDVVPTEICPWRGHLLRGEVHDENCYSLGGVAAHAGLFGDILDVLRFGELWLNALHGSSSFLTQTVANKFWTFTHLPGHSSNRALGWDGVTPGSSMTGKL